jgi:hypothetical protein
MYLFWNSYRLLVLTTVVLWTVVLYSYHLSKDISKRHSLFFRGCILGVRKKEFNIDIQSVNMKLEIGSWWVGGPSGTGWFSCEYTHREDSTVTKQINENIVSSHKIFLQPLTKQLI